MNNYVTSIVRTHERENNIYIKRDDLLPVAFGGNKVRIASEFISDMRRSGKNTIVGYGNSRSNMCRALAVLCSMEHIPCHIISSGDDDGSYQDTWNGLIINSTGAVIHKCRKTEVAPTVESVCKGIIDSGHKPYYIFGDKFGKGNEATPLKAYDSVYKEISEQTPEILGGGYKFDYIFLPTGTGMTQSGLIAGQYRCQGNEKIIGISVARKEDVVKKIIADNLNKYLNTEKFHPESVIVTDKYLKDGYGLYDDKIIGTIDHVLQNEGIALDPVYTGKGYNGMLEYLQDEGIQGKNVLFILTGSIPLFFDYAKSFL